MQSTKQLNFRLGLLRRDVLRESFLRAVKNKNFLRFLVAFYILGVLGLSAFARL